MTSEERFTKIENALHTVSENQARQDAAIRDLIVVSGTLLESQKETDGQIRELAAGQRKLSFDMAEWAKVSAETQKTLEALIDAVNRIIGGRNGQP